MKVVEIIILSILALYALFNIIGNIFISWYAKKLEFLENLEFDLEDSDQFLQAAEIVFGPVEETFEDATLLITEQYSPEKVMIYDFSKWEDSKIIGVIAMHEEVPQNEEEERMSIVPNQTVCRFKDGTILWIK